MTTIIHTKGAEATIKSYAKFITPEVLALAESFAASRQTESAPRLWPHDIHKAISQTLKIPLAEFLFCRLAQQFPVMQHKLGPDWMVKDFDPDRFFDHMGVWSSGERLVGMFLLNVWNPGYAKSKGWTFNLFDAVGTLDRPHLAPIIEWMLNPVWP
jgi:hypothetical protein